MSELSGFDSWKTTEPDANDPGRVDGNRYPDPCDWCQCLVYPDKQIHAHHGGRFCSDECASYRAEEENPRERDEDDGLGSYSDPRDERDERKYA